MPVSIEVDTLFLLLYINIYANNLPKVNAHGKSSLWQVVFFKCYRGATVWTEETPYLAQPLRIISTVESVVSVLLRGLGGLSLSVCR